MSDPRTAATAILASWLEETPAEKRFARDPALDRAILERFGDLHGRVLADHASGWRGDARTLLAAVILLDQFSRNIYRGAAAAFDADPLARALTREALTRGWDAGLTEDERRFLYMPLMHSEALDDQLRSLRLFEAIGDTGDFARRHAEQIARFGRFPGRNAALGRETTPAEAQALAAGAAF